MDKPLILRKVAELDTCLEQIREFSGLSVEAYLGDWKTQRIVERTLQIMIELCSDIAGHLIAAAGMRTPTGYADTFMVLAENQVIPPDLGAQMERMAKFRNIVVHQYATVDGAIVILILHNHLPDFVSYKRAVLAFLARPEESRGS